MFNNNCVHYETVPRWKWIARGDERRVREEEDVAVFLMAKKTCRGRRGPRTPLPCLPGRRFLLKTRLRQTSIHYIPLMENRSTGCSSNFWTCSNIASGVKELPLLGIVHEMRNVHKSFWFLINLWCILSWCSWTVIGAGKQESSYPFDLCQVHQPACTKIFAKCRNRYKSTWRIICRSFWCIFLTSSCFYAA